MKKQTGLLLLILPLLSFQASCTKINPDEIGVRTLNLGYSKGVVMQDFKPGFHRAVWLLDTWHRFPRTVQRLQFLKDSGTSMNLSGGPLQLSSVDGDHVTLDAEIFFRILDDKACFVLQDSGPGEQYKMIVRSLTIGAVNSVFGKMKTEDFYNAKNREESCQAINQLLQEKLKLRGIEMVNFLVEKIEFDPKYENLIKQKKIADQQVQLQISKAKAAEEKGKVEKIQAETAVKIQQIQRETDAGIMRLSTETDLKIAKILAEADKYSVYRKAEADLYKSQKTAEGVILKKTSEAEGTERMNQALTGEGSENVMALEAARNLQLNEVTFPSVGIDWFNPADMARRLGAQTIFDASSLEEVKSDIKQ